MTSRRVTLPRAMHQCSNEDCYSGQFSLSWLLSCSALLCPGLQFSVATPTHASSDVARMLHGCYLAAITVMFQPSSVTVLSK